MPTGFVPNRGFEEELKAEAPYGESLEESARAVVDMAKTFAPVGQTGNYRRGLKVVRDGDEVYASGTDFKSHWIEWGSAHNEPSAPLRRGAKAAGLELKESGRK